MSDRRTRSVGGARGARRSLGWRTGALALALLAPVARGAAQAPDPRGAWRTLHTEHLHVHFPARLEALGARAAREAEWAWARLARDLVPPRGPVDLVVTDASDVSNGFARITPTNRVVIFDRPPVDDPTLRFTDDWVRLVVTHELAHLFHLDRARGPWRAAQRVFGRHPAAFPNAYGPSWLSEGLAVHVESAVTGSGRLVGTEHRVIAAARAREGRVPRLDELSLATSIWPGPQGVYVFGSLLVDRLVTAPPTGGRPGGLRALVDAQAARWNPFRLDAAARRATGTSFTATWRGWRDSLEAAVDGTRADAGRGDAGRGDAGRGDAGRAATSAEATTLAAGWRGAAAPAWTARHPRWDGDSAVVYAANDARDVPGAYRVRRDAGGPAGAGERIGRRNGLAPNVPLVGGPFAGGLLFTQLEFDGPYALRGDLWVQRDRARGDAGFGAGGRGERRLTRGARLTLPDARADGAIVAVQIVPGATRLVRVSPDGRRIVPLTTARPDTQWAEPRWSPDGTRLAAVRVEPGAVASVLVLDTLGRVRHVAARARAVLAAPAWTADGRALVWASDRSGTPRLETAAVPEAAAPGATGDAADVVPPVRVLAAGPAPLREPAPSPDGRALAAIATRGAGEQLVLGAMASDVAAADGAPVAAGATVYPPPPAPDPASPLADSRVRPYRPWRTLVPRWWTPVVGEADGGATLLGAASGAEDAIGRTAWAAQLAMNARSADVEGFATLRSRRLGVPVLDLSVAQSFAYDTVLPRVGGVATPLDRRSRTAVLVATLPRPRVRTNASLALGVGVESRAFDSPDPTLPPLAARRLGATRPLVTLGAFWGNARRPTRSISPEDGVALSADVQQRWGVGERLESAGPGTLGGTARALLTVRAYRALGSARFAHHVVALRAAYGVADARAVDEWRAGGVSGGAVALVPGVTLGDGARPFGVRGVAAGAQRGTRAAAASLEYRLPLAMPGRGAALLPLFLDRVSVTGFADAASAWCPAAVDRAAQPACARDAARTPLAPRWLASVGGELALDVAAPYDAGYRVRLGVARALGAEPTPTRALSVYATLGLPF